MYLGKLLRKVGRILVCSTCACKTCEGTTQVFRKIVFHFCRECWTSRREQCNAWMQKVAA
jgi:hypothetical protein